MWACTGESPAAPPFSAPAQAKRVRDEDEEIGAFLLDMFPLEGLLADTLNMTGGAAKAANKHRNAEEVEANENQKDEEVGVHDRLVASATLPRPCATCKRLRVKCDRKKPCSRCLKRGLQCYLPPHVRRGRPPRWEKLQSLQPNCKEQTDNEKIARAVFPVQPADNEKIAMAIFPVPVRS
jgi:molybdenum cofactor biosynthesis enzyme MoaA